MDTFITWTENNFATKEKLLTFSIPLIKDVSSNVTTDLSAYP
jgi:hypothetical protein